jgi:hypothetical protein
VNPSTSLPVLFLRKGWLEIAAGGLLKRMEHNHRPWFRRASFVTSTAIITYLQAFHYCYIYESSPKDKMRVCGTPVPEPVQSEYLLNLVLLY